MGRHQTSRIPYPLGRALAEKALAQSLGQPSLILLSYAIEQNRKAYYKQLEQHQRMLDVTGWLVWFGQTVLAAQQLTLQRVRFYIAKANFFDRSMASIHARKLLWQGCLKPGQNALLAT